MLYRERGGSQREFQSFCCSTGDAVGSSVCFCSTAQPTTVNAIDTTFQTHFGELVIIAQYCMPLHRGDRPGISELRCGVRTSAYLSLEPQCLGRRGEWPIGSCGKIRNIDGSADMLESIKLGCDVGTMIASRCKGFHHSHTGHKKSVGHKGGRAFITTLWLGADGYRPCLSPPVLSAEHP